MTAIPHERVVDRRPLAWYRIREMWASLAIAVMWAAVLFTAVFGPDITSTSTTSTATVPSAVAVALFATFGTWAVAKHGLSRRTSV